MKHIYIKSAVKMNAYAIVYPFLTSGQMTAIKKATKTIEKPKVQNNTYKIIDGVLRKKSNLKRYPQTNKMAVNIITNI